ncbi:hypothetical protein SO802_032316 [Lithocarpus litseifolius]|uniref:RNase H type-1 domain-containing protein n=1 Tax=Lithocarpus litseifolius TaxID=425828 RepID=A0AAW2BN35_9ROSI
MKVVKTKYMDFDGKEALNRSGIQQLNYGASLVSSLKINFDGAMFGGNFCNRFGSILAVLPEKVTLPPLVDDIEALVAVRAILFALDLGFSSIILEDDSETTIKALRNNEESFATFSLLQNLL